MPGDEPQVDRPGLEPIAPGTARARLRELRELDERLGEGDPARDLERRELQRILNGAATPISAELERLEDEAHAASEESIAHLTAGQRPRLVTGEEAMTRERMLEVYAPADEDEELAAATAVHRHREDAEALELLAKLGTFEQLLMERAFGAGVDATLERMRQAAGSAAATLHAEPLMRLSRPPALDARLRPPLPPGERTLQAARIALRAATTARIAHDPPAGQRMLDVRQALEALEERARRFHIDDDRPRDNDGAEAERADREALIVYADDLERLILGLRSAVEGEVP